MHFVLTYRVNFLLKTGRCNKKPKMMFGFCTLFFPSRCLLGLLPPTMHISGAVFHGWWASSLSPITYFLGPSPCHSLWPYSETEGSWEKSQLDFLCPGLPIWIIPNRSDADDCAPLFFPGTKIGIPSLPHVAPRGCSSWCPALTPRSSWEDSRTERPFEGLPLRLGTAVPHLSQAPDPNLSFLSGPLHTLKKLEIKR